MSLDEVRLHARNAVETYGKIRARVCEAVPDPVRQERLIGPFPRWAAYVLKLGEPARVPTRSQAEISLGSAAAIRAFALRLLQIADEIDPVVPPVDE